MMLIEVTQENIEEGNQLIGLYDFPVRSKSCPVYCAARDSGLDEVSVGASQLCWIDDQELLKAKLLPLGVKQRIKRYDNTGRMEPFSFEIDV